MHLKIIIFLFAPEPPLTHFLSPCGRRGLRCEDSCFELCLIRTTPLRIRSIRKLEISKSHPCQDPYLLPRRGFCVETFKKSCVFVRPFVRRSHVLGTVFGPNFPRFRVDSAILAVQKGVPNVTFSYTIRSHGIAIGQNLMTTTHQMFQRTIITHGRYNPTTKVPSGPPCPAGEI